MEETLNINLTNNEYPVLEVSLVQAVGPKGDDGGWFNLKGDWSLGIAYVPYDLVNTATGSYVCVTSNIDSEPTVNNLDWMRLIYNVTDESKIDKTSIKQMLGASTTDLLSQNIISTNINRIDNELSNKIDISQLSNYYNKSETYNRSEINSIAGGFDIKVVGDIEEMIDKNTIYLISKNTPDENNIYDKYIVFEGRPELLTDTSKSNLSNFITFNDLNEYVSDDKLADLMGDYYTKNKVYTKIETDNLLANLNLDIDTSGFATIELLGEVLGEYIPISKVKQTSGGSTSDLMSQKAITDLINSILNDLQDDLSTRPTQLDIGDIVNDFLRDNPIITDIQDGLSTRPTQADIGDIVNDFLTDNPTIITILDDINDLKDTNPTQPDIVDLDAYLKDTLLGAEEDSRDPKDILNARFAEKLDSADLDTTSTIVGINTSLSGKLNVGSLDEYSKKSSSEVELELTEDLIKDKYFIRVFDETSDNEVKMSTLSLHNNFSINYPTVKELKDFDGTTKQFPFTHNLIRSSAKLNKNGLIYYIDHGFSIEDDYITLDTAPTSEDVIFIEAIYLD